MGHVQVYVCKYSHSTNWLSFYFSTGKGLGSGIVVMKGAPKSLSKIAFYNQLSFVCSSVHWELYFLCEERALYKTVIGKAILLVILLRCFRVVRWGGMSFHPKSKTLRIIYCQIWSGHSFSNYGLKQGLHVIILYLQHQAQCLGGSSFSRMWT